MASLVGESLREMAVLILVFAPLDVIVQGKSLTFLYGFSIVGIVGVLFVVGVALEVKWSSTR